MAKIVIRSGIALAAAALGVQLLGGCGEIVPRAEAKETMQPLRNDAELRAVLRRSAAVQRRLQESAPAQPSPPPPPAAAEAMSAPADSGITNVQTAGVDEGGIVKQHGRHLVVLRRGRLFTVDTSGGRLAKIDQADAFPPGDRTGGAAWYDELLVAGDTVTVIGFNYARRGTEINRFRIDAEGHLTYLDTYQLRSNDYYSADNYASRLIGNRLIIYTPLQARAQDPIAALPGLRRWSEGGPSAGFERLALAHDVYVPELLLYSPKANINTYHSVTSCDLAARRMTCSSTVVLGGWGRTFYVGADAVYVWTGNLFQRAWNDKARADGRGLVYRMPLDGSAPQAAVVWGGPVDQFSFRSEPDGSLHVLVRSGYGGDAMWLSRWQSRGAVALLTLPESAFNTGRGYPQRGQYRSLPGDETLYNIENRFIGNHLVYAGSNYTPRGSAGLRIPEAYAVSLSDGRVTELSTGGAVSRIDRMGADAILVGQSPAGALRFSSVGLNEPGGPAILDSYDLPSAREGESRSQAFFFRSDSPDGRDGVLGLPVARPWRKASLNAAGIEQSIFFMTRRDRRLTPAGDLGAGSVNSIDDACKASCIDWYGNARPIFLGNRVFALMGYELVEGRLLDGTIGEVQRLDFSPQRRQVRD